MTNFKTQIKNGNKLVCVVPSTWYEVKIENNIETFYDSRNGVSYSFIDRTWKAGQWINNEFVVNGG